MLPPWIRVDLETKAIKMRLHAPQDPQSPNQNPAVYRHTVSEVRKLISTRTLFTVPVFRAVKLYTHRY